MGFAGLCAYWVTLERLSVRYREVLQSLDERNRWGLLGGDAWKVLEAMLVAAPTALCLLLAHRAPHLAGVNLTFITMGWFILALTLFVTSLGFHQRWYRYAALVVLALSIGRVFLIDLKEQDDPAPHRRLRPFRHRHAPCKLRLLQVARPPARTRRERRRRIGGEEMP